MLFILPVFVEHLLCQVLSGSKQNHGLPGAPEPTAGWGWTPEAVWEQEGWAALPQGEAAAACWVAQGASGRAVALDKSKAPGRESWAARASEHRGGLRLDLTLPLAVPQLRDL